MTVDRLKVTLAALLGMLVSAGARASIPDANGVFTACVLRSDYTIRLIDTADSRQRCNTS